MILRRNIGVCTKSLGIKGLLLFSSLSLPLMDASETVGSASDLSRNPWEKPRDLSSFQQLIKHSPFSLPTSEESSPLADRYAMTGIVNINGE